MSPFRFGGSIMEKLKTASLSVEGEISYLLADGSTVSAEVAAQAGQKARKKLLFIGFFLVLVGLISGLFFVLDLIENGSGWAMFIVVELVLLGFAGALMVISFRLDDEKYGVSTLNFQKRMAKPNPNEILIRNDIKASEIIELHANAGNVIFISADHQKWQYRRKGKLSPVMDSHDLASFEIVKNGLKYDATVPDLSLAEDPFDTFGILLRFFAAEKLSVELECRTKQVAIECAATLAQFKK